MSCCVPPARVHGDFAFAEDPERDASDARLFWQVDRQRSAIRACATACRRQAHGAIELSRLPWPVTILKVDGASDRFSDRFSDRAHDGTGDGARYGGSEELAIRSPGGTIRLSLDAGTMLEGPVTLSYVIDASHLPSRILALRRWDALLRTGAIPSALRPRTAGRARWMPIIATLDALAEGCSLRETAKRVFGADETRAAWNHPSDYLKMRVRRLVAQARELAGGGYLDLL